MKNADAWQPTKFVTTARGLRASRNPEHVGISSRFIADILAQSYECALQTHARGRLLDMGCGYVPLYGVYRDLVQEAVCIDWGHTLHPSIHLDYAVDLCRRLPFVDASFDTVLLTDVLEHLAEPAAAMCEAARILRAGGKLIIGVPFYYGLHEEPHDYHRFTKFALQRMCALGGLKILELQAYGGLPEVLVDLTSKGLTYFPRPARVLLRPFHTAASLLHKKWPLQRVSAWSKESFPLGYIVVGQKLEEVPKDQ